MIMTFKTSNLEEFGTLIEGETFIDPEYDEGTVLIVVKPMIEVILQANKDITDGDEFDGFAADLRSGAIIGYHNSDEIIPVSTELIVDKS